MTEPGTGPFGSPVLLCADYYAMTPGVSDGIRQLVEQHRLSATSAMVNTPYWPQEAARLRELRGGASVGLHLNLTEGRPLTPLSFTLENGQFPGLSALLTASILRRLNREELGQEIRAQLDAFEAHFQHPPDHVDGHQHCHVLPVIRRCLLEECSQRYPAGALLFRAPASGTLPWSSSDPRSSGNATTLKTLFVGLLSTGLRRQAGRRGFAVNRSFSGFSSFVDKTAIVQEIEAITRPASKSRTRPRAGHMTMCHPGLPDAEPLAEHSDMRQHEFDTLVQSALLPAHILHPERSADGRIDWQSIPGYR